HWDQLRSGARRSDSERGLMPVEPQLVLPSSVAEAIRASGANSGDIEVRQVPGDQLVVVSGFGTSRLHRPIRSEWLDTHCSSAASRRPGVGFWYRATPELHQMWRAAGARGAAITI